MKKIILSAISLLFCTYISAQELAWSNTFDSQADLQGWTILDTDGNGNTWVQGANWYGDANDNYKTKEGSSQVLRYSIGKSDGSYVPNYDNENNWAISPAIDLTGASGKIELAMYWRLIDPRNYNVGLDIYISETNDLATFEALSANASPYALWSNDFTFPANPDEFAEKVFDISSLAGKKIYIGMKRAGGNVDQYQQGNLNIDEMSIYAENLLATNEIKAGKSLTKVAQNPVGNALMLQLNPAMAAAKTSVQVYSAAGQQVLNAKYAKELNVSALAPGMYLARVSDGTLTETVKFIKK